MAVVANVAVVIVDDRLQLVLGGGHQQFGADQLLADVRGKLLDSAVAEQVPERVVENERRGRPRGEEDPSQPAPLAPVGDRLGHDVVARQLVAGDHAETPSPNGRGKSRPSRPYQNRFGVAVQLQPRGMEVFSIPLARRRRARLLARAVALAAVGR